MVRALSTLAERLRPKLAGYQGAQMAGYSGAIDSRVYIIVDEVLHYSDHGFKPFSVIEGETVFVLLPKGGGNCGKSTGSPCYRVAIWDVEDGEFNVAGRK